MGFRRNCILEIVVVIWSRLDQITIQNSFILPQMGFRRKCILEIVIVIWSRLRPNHDCFFVKSLVKSPKQLDYIVKVKKTFVFPVKKIRPL